MRDHMPTITDDAELEKARLASLPSKPPVQPTPENDVARLRAKLSPLSRVPSLAKRINELGSLLEDPKAAYVLGFIDGVLTLETILDIAGLPEIETLALIDRMIGLGVVKLARV